MAFIKGTATNYQTMLDALHAAATGDSLATAVPLVGGVGYVVGDVLDVSGGTGTVTAQVTVTTAPGGVVTGVRISNAGVYTVDPSATPTTTGGTGAGATLTATWASNGWVSQRATNVGGSGEREVILKGIGLGGTDEIYVGARSYNDSGTGACNWELAGFTGFSGALTWPNQPGISPGRNDVLNDGGAFVPLANSSMTYWLAITPRKIVGVFKISTYYGSMYMGFLNPYATSAENPYPLYICGCANLATRLSTSTEISLSGIGNPQQGAAHPGNGLFRFTDGAWYSVFNATGTGSSRVASTTGFILYPTGGHGTSPASGANAWFTGSGVGSFSSFIPQSGAPGVPTITLIRTDNTPNPVPILIPLTIICNSPSENVIGELDDCVWFSGTDGAAPEDTLTIGSSVYRVFRNANQTELWQMFAVKEA